MFDLHADLKRTNDFLERIAIALERIAGPEVMISGPDPAGDFTDAEVEKIRAEIHRTEPQDIRRVDLNGEKKTIERLRKFGE